MRDGAQIHDANDRLAPLRSLFDLPPDKVYLDGISLGAMPRVACAAVQQVMLQQWAGDLIASWNKHDWIDLPRIVGEQIAPLVGAASGQVLCADTISVNLFKLLASALELRPGRSVILLAENDFPTDGYIAQGLAHMLGNDRCQLRRVPATKLEEALDGDTAVLLLSEVNYRSGERYSMRELTRAAHEAGALAIWNLAHSAGAMPVYLDACKADFAVGCGSKFFNGGPGAPGFLYVAERHQNVVQPLSGWFGHRHPFSFEERYRAGEGVQRFQAWTPPILSMAAMHAALRVFDGVNLDTLRSKSLALTDAFLDGLQSSGIAAEFRCLTPRDHTRRGSQVSLAHEQGWGISQALIERGVIVDFRAPDIVRFGFAPLYNRFADVATALSTLQSVLDERAYEDARYAACPAVT